MCWINAWLEGRSCSNKKRALFTRGFGNTNNFQSRPFIRTKAGAYEDDGSIGTVEKWLAGLVTDRNELSGRKVGSDPVEPECNLLIALKARNAMISSSEASAQ